LIEDRRRRSRRKKERRKESGVEGNKTVSVLEF
jgi:hypothetical protein